MAVIAQKRAFSTRFYFGVFFMLVLLLVGFSIFSPIEFGEDITGQQVVETVSESPSLYWLSFIAIFIFVVVLLVLTSKMMSRVM